MTSLVAAGTAAALLAADATGYRYHAYPWPDGVVRYYNAAPDQAHAVELAVDAWNRSGARVRFVASPRARAQLVIRHLPGSGCPAHARATVGYLQGRTARVLIPRLDRAEDGCNAYLTARFVAHELGHVLGLRHEDRVCAAMNSSTSYRGSSRCDRLPPWTWRCRLLEHDDIRGVIEVYGGSTPRVRPEARCPLYDAIRPPAGFTAAHDPEQSGVRLSFTRPFLPGAPVFLSARVNASSNSGYAFTKMQDVCPAQRDLPAARRLSWNVDVGQAAVIHDRAPVRGRYCYALWAFDGLNRPSREPALAWVEIR